MFTDTWILTKTSRLRILCLTLKKQYIFNCENCNSYVFKLNLKKGVDHGLSHVNCLLRLMLILAKYLSPSCILTNGAHVIDILSLSFYKVICSTRLTYILYWYLWAMQQLSLTRKNCLLIGRLEFTLGPLFGYYGFSLSILMIKTNVRSLVFCAWISRVIV